MKISWAVLVLFSFLAGAAAATAATPPLALVAKYKMPAEVQGRFDHLAADVPGNRLFLAAESAHEVLVFNLRTGRFLHAIKGIGIPHAILVRHRLNRIYITDGGAGEVRIYNGKTYRLLKTVKLKVDSDSIGYNPATHLLYVVNGGGDAHQSFSMLSVVNTTTGRKVADIRIDGRTLEAMALARHSSLLYVNNPALGQVDVVNRRTRTVMARWPVKECGHNVAMALDQSANRLFSACRSGAIAVFDTRTGKEGLPPLPIAHGVDDMVFNPASKRLYASCGGDGGSIDVYQIVDPGHFKYLGAVASAPGGKNEVLVPQLGRLFVTIPPRAGAPGEVYVYKVE